MQSFGFLGLGIMGSAMAKNLLKAGFQVTVWNRSQDKCAELAALGARVAATPAEVTASCPITFAILADPAAAEAVCFAPDDPDMIAKKIRACLTAGADLIVTNLANGGVASSLGASSASVTNLVLDSGT